MLLDDQDQVLMLWRHRFVPDRWGWELPGGLVDADEEPADAAARELEEETGYRAAQVEHIATFQPMPGMIDAEHFVFVGTNAKRVGDPTDLSEAARRVGAVGGGATNDRCGRDLERWLSRGAVTDASEAPLSVGVVVLVGGADHAFGFVNS